MRAIVRAWRAGRAWIGVATVLVLAACTGVNVSQLQEGDCYNATGPGPLTTVETVECSEPHAFEVFSEVTHPAGEGEDYPGDAGFAEFAGGECLPAFEGYVGLDYADSGLIASSVSPDEDGWGAGERQVLCVLSHPEGDEPRTESAAGAEV